MTGSGAEQHAVRLPGRERECAAIDRMLDGAGSGTSGALVVRGEAGIGKSALLDYAAQRAASRMTVLRVDGVEAESDLPFAGLYGLPAAGLQPSGRASAGAVPGAGGRAGTGAVLGPGPAAHLRGGDRPARGRGRNAAGAVPGR